MRSLKTSGGLTRGRGMTEQQRTIWTLAMLKCAEINHTMQELSGVWQATSEQNKDMSPSRLTRDWKDTCTVAQYLKERNPFECVGTLCNIATGVHGHGTVNADSAKEVGFIRSVSPTWISIPVWLQRSRSWQQGKNGIGHFWFRSPVEFVNSIKILSSSRSFVDKKQKS